MRPGVAIGPRPAPLTRQSAKTPKFACPLALLIMILSGSSNQKYNYQNIDQEKSIVCTAGHARIFDVGFLGCFVFERRSAGLYHNTAAIIGADGEIEGIYRKMHIPDDPLYFEKFYFTPGDLGFVNFDTRFGRLGVLVCWDQWYPEAARLSSIAGANILFYPTAIGWHPSEKAQYGAAQLDAWKTIQRAHAIANGIYVAAVNRVGFEGPPEHGLEFWGSSFVADPFGQVIAEATTSSEEILVVECDPHRMEEVRRGWPFLRDRRIDAYAPIVKRWLD